MTKTTTLFLLLLFFNTAFLVSQEQESLQEKGITLDRYVAFLNQVAANDCFHLYESRNNQVIRLGEPGNYHYEAIQPLDDLVVLLNWNDVFRYSQWRLLTEPSFFACQDFACIRCMYGDSELKSNMMTFQLARVEAYQASLEESAVDAGIDDIIEWLIAGAVIEGVRRPETEGTAVTTESKSVSEKAKRETALTLEDYEQVLEEHPEASRFVIQENKESNSLSLCIAEESNTDKKKINFENKKVTEILRTLLKQHHRKEEEIEKILPKKKRKDEGAALSAALLRQALALPVQAIAQSPNKYEEFFAVHQDLIHDFQNRIKEAQEAIEAVEETRAKLHEQDHDWYVTLIEKHQFRLADLSAAEARVAEIFEGAKDRIEQCVIRQIRQQDIKEPLDTDIAILEKLFSGCSSISEDIQMANEAYARFATAMMSNDGSLESVAEEAQKQWEKIESDIQRVDTVVKNVHRSLQEDLQHLQETYNLYQEDQNKLLSELSRQQEVAIAAWESVFSRADGLLIHLIKNEDLESLKNAKKVFNTRNQEMLAVQKSFQETERAAATCLEDRRIYFFEEENQRLKSLDAMSHVWKQEIKQYDDLVKEKETMVDLVESARRLQPLFDHAKNFIIPFIAIEEILFNNRQLEEKIKIEVNEVNALREAVEAIKALQEAEQRLTRATKMQKKSHETVHSNAWASDALYNDFIQKRKEAPQARAKAILTEKELSAKMKQAQESYCGLNQLLASLPSEPQISLEKLVTQIRNSWVNAKSEAITSQKVWKEAIRATDAAKDAKVMWAKNILRLAAMGTGSFSLGKATKKEGELLGKLWIGLNPKLEEKSHQVAQEVTDLSDYFSGKKYGELLSHDQLKRLRTVSYKPKHQEYQINFERRSTDQKDWNEKEPDGSSTWGNGHLTVTNSHANDSLEDSMSLRYVDLTPSQHHESIYAYKATELIERAEHLNREALKKQGRLEEVRSQLRVATCEGKETEHFHSEIAAIEQELPALWQHVFGSYEEGLKMAPKEKKEWWLFQQDRVRVQEKLDYSNRGKEILDDAIQWGVRQDDRYAEDMEKHTRAFRLVPLEKDVLKEHWNQKIKSLKQKWEEEQSRLLYYQAERAQYHLFDLTQKAEEGVSILDLHNNAVQAWDKAITKFKTMLDNYREAPSKMRSCWQSGLEVSQYEKRKLSLSQPAFEAVKQENLAKQVLRQVNDSLKFSDDAVAESEKEVAAWDEALDVCQKNLKAIPSSRKEFCFWWEEQYRLMEAKKNRAMIRDFANKGNQANGITDALLHQAQRSNKSQLWNKTIKQNHKATKWMQQACEKVKECLEGPHAAFYSGEKKNLSNLQIILKYYSAKNCILEANKAAAIARGFQRSITHSNKEEVKRHFSEAIEKWEQAIEQLTQILQEDALCDANRQETCRKDLKYSWEQKIQCMHERNAL